MTDLDRIEEEINENNEVAHLQRCLVKSVLALSRRLDFIITNVAVPYINNNKARATASEEPGFTHVDGPPQPTESEGVTEHVKFQQS
jgi:hypothetical protein